MNSPDAALVVAAHGQRGQLEFSDGRLQAYVVKGRRTKVVCGDRVQWESSQHDDRVTVTTIEPRSNSLQRLDTVRATTETLAANIDLVVVVVARLPKPDWFVIDRYLCAAATMGAATLLVANKSDLKTPAEIVGEFANYRAVGYRVLPTSATTLEGLSELRAALAGNTAILVGQSGVGKSSLINALLPGADLATASLSRSTDEGRHTTTASIMHRIDGGGRLIDSPGVRDFIPAIRAGVAVQVGFPEILAAADNCRFTDCRHLREPGCAVKAAVQAERITARRYESYRRLLRSAAEQWSG
ncbi:MAG: ribosome small subunit-dependent GTPase A [Gammaproteobacteria bacterium]|nr:ribosome small subunit-dependent GTPase A [Gammaproteobacteria bacterium]